jgi:hypothetical protein
MLEVADATGYAVNSLGAYYSKKLKNYAVFPIGGGRYRCQGLLALSDEQYFSHMSQKSTVTEDTVQNSLARRLIGRAFAALTLSLEVYNRPLLRNRIEAFAILIVNAWELLLKAELVESEGESALYYPDTSRSLSLRDVLKRLMPESDPVRLNLERVEAIRDDAIHLLIPELQPHLGRLFQASVLNFVERAKVKTNRHPLEGESPGLLSLVLDGPPVDLAVLKMEYGEATADRVRNFVDEFEQEEHRLGCQSFAVSVEYKLVLTKRAGEADLTLTTGSSGQHTVIVHQPKDIDKLYPLRSKDVLNRLGQVLPDDVKINTHTLQAILFKHKLKQDAAFHYRVEAANLSLFSERFIDFVLQRAQQPNWIDEARGSYAHHLQSKRANHKSRLTTKRPRGGGAR